MSLDFKSTPIILQPVNKWIVPDLAELFSWKVHAGLQILRLRTSCSENEHRYGKEISLTMIYQLYLTYYLHIFDQKVSNCLNTSFFLEKNPQNNQKKRTKISVDCFRKETEEKTLSVIKLFGFFCCCWNELLSIRFVGWVTATLVPGETFLSDSLQHCGGTWNSIHSLSTTLIRLSLKFLKYNIIQHFYRICCSYFCKS